jgi:hypothetical protein
MAYSPVACNAPQLGALLARELGLAAAEAAFGAGHGHALAGAHPQQVDVELDKGGQDVENILPIGSCGS